MSRSEFSAHQCPPAAAPTDSGGRENTVSAQAKPTGPALSSQGGNTTDTSTKEHDRKMIYKESRRERLEADRKTRRERLETDKWVASVTATSVKCQACGKTLRLDKRYEYYPGFWEKHKKRCKEIKKMRTAEAARAVTGHRGQSEPSDSDAATAVDENRAQKRPTAELPT